MSRSKRTAWTRRILALLLAPLSLLTSIGLTAGTAAAQSKGQGGGGNKPTTTTAPPSNSSTTTTVASTGGGGTNGVANPKLTAVVSLSLHRVLATYDRDLDAAALQASSYAFYSTQAVNLPVTGVSRATNNQAYVTTAAQEPVTYTVKSPKTSRPVTFTGSTLAEPKVVSAETLSRTQILITFSEPMGPSAFLPTSYTVNVEGSSATLNVTEAAQFGSDRTQVVITTAPQEPGLKYVISFCGCITNTAGTNLDPGTTTSTVTGSSVAPGPMMLSASSDGDSKVILTFNAPLSAASATNTANYTVTPGLAILSATLQGDGRQVVLVTGPQFQIQYSLVVNVTGTDGNPVNPGYNSTTFTGNRPVDTSRPKVVSAGSTGNKSVVVQFSKAMADSTADPSRFAIVQTVTHPEVGALVVSGAEFTGPDRQSVKLTTMSQAEVTYQVTVNNVTDVMGNPLADRTTVGGVLVDPTSFTFPGTPPTECPGNPPPGTVTIADLPDADLTKKSLKQLIGSGTDFLTTFKVGDNVAVAGETVRTVSKIVDKTHLEVSTAFSTEKSGLSYRISCPDEPVNSDADTLYDHEETRGWQITIALANNGSQVRQVTSSPFNVDTDADGLKDDVERSLNIDPRDRDTDDDGLSDFSEFNEIFSDPTRQDTDGDGLFDGLEVTSFRTSATEADTDGDLMPDGAEINLANRNPRVADLPKPSLEIGAMDLHLDVRFEDTTSEGTTVVDTKQRTATLSQSESQEFSHMDSQSVEASTVLSQTAGFTIEGGFPRGVGASVSYENSNEQGSAQSFTTEFTESSSQAASQTYEDSLTSSVQQDANASRARRIDGATVKATVTLKNIGDIPFSIRNLQVTALVQDSQNPAHLTPVATLTPEVAPDTGFNLGPLTPERGPIVMSAGSDRVFPSLVEELMRNPRSVVFRFSNYDITDEGGNNFAFTSQDVFNRTAGLVIDYGGYDTNGDREGDLAEIIRVATGIGRWVADTDGDGTVSEAEARGPAAAATDPKARWVAFDFSGKLVPITLREALQAAGLTEYDEATTPSSSLTAAERARSYSIFNLEGVGMRLFRIRGVQRAASAAAVDNKTEWQIHTANGLDRTLGLDNTFLSSASGAKLLLVQDSDHDGLPAMLEWMNGCRDDDRDTDDDGLDDRFETSIGWKVTTGTSGQVPSTRTVRPRCDSRDGDNDGLLDFDEAPGAIEKDATGLIRIDAGHLPQRKAPGTTHTVATYAAMQALAAQPGDLALVTDLDPDGTGPEPPAAFLRTGSATTPWVKISAKEPMKLTMADFITNPVSKDTDGDGATDGRELTPHQVVLKWPPPDAPQCVDSPGSKCTLALMTSGEWRDSDGDTAEDGLEEFVGGDPTQSDRNNFADDDGDGLVNIQETSGSTIRIEGVSTVPLLCKSVCTPGSVTEHSAPSNPTKADSDGDGLSDLEEVSLGTHPSNPDTDSDGITDSQELAGYDVPGIGIVKTNPRDTDSDNDKRDDGAELGRSTFWCTNAGSLLVRCGSYVVRVQGEAPYEVAVSNPSKADADLDMLVDGDELTTGTDPTKYNTDGDTTSDYDELGLERNPLLPDMHVTISFARLFVAKDADPSNDSGDFRFDFDVVNAAGSTQQGLDHLDSRFPKCGDEDGWLCWFNDTPSGQRVVHINDGQTLIFPTVTVDAGLVSTSPKVPQNIAIKGHLIEDDDDKEDCSVYLPDLSASASDGTSVLNGADLKLGTNVVVIHRAVKCLSGADLEFTLVMSYTAK